MRGIRLDLDGPVTEGISAERRVCQVCRVIGGDGAVFLGGGALLGRDFKRGLLWCDT